jgi:hypothetical protein
MSTSSKLIGFIALYFTPCMAVYLLSKYGLFEFYTVFDSLLAKTPALTNYATCAPNPESIKSLHLFNIFYSFVVPAILFKKSIVKTASITIKPILITLPLVAYGVLAMLNGFQFPSADGAGAAIGSYYCNSEFVSFFVISFISAGASTFYLMFFLFVYLFIKTKANKTFKRDGLQPPLN